MIIPKNAKFTSGQFASVFVFLLCEHQSAEQVSNLKQPVVVWSNTLYRKIMNQWSHNSGDEAGDLCLAIIIVDFNGVK